MKRSSLLIVVMLSLIWSAGLATATATTITADSSGVITIPLSRLSATARIYDFSATGTTVRFIVLMGADGQPRVAFDACEVCGGSLGYEQRGTDIRCRACGRVFRIDDIGTKNRASGCWPSYLPYLVVGANIVIKAVDLERGKALFR